MIDYSQFGLQNEPIASDSIRDGADVILFSGDKLIGGPQCGIVAGKKVYIDRILKDPLMRAMRVGKMTLAALHATLSLYRDDAKARQSVPLLRMLSMPVENLKLRAEKIAPQLNRHPMVASCEAVKEEAMLGGGSLPAQKIPTWCVAITPSVSVDKLTAKLRNSKPAILGRVQKGKLLLDMRTVSPAEDLELLKAFEALQE
jgi:L-seryl-tRNA(Ser) seleniumtransferase